ncbi:MAG TPA: transketolase C-terminal domain-containing protein [Candidatus Diapherotrites archaeon]|mgnify:CR=1 FL=1|nr:transketolase C-terminal domain-containing protein [Candidatus Diapherotrites archaeon]
MTSGNKVSKREFLNGDEAVAYGVRLCRPNVVSVYPITPQTIVVEKISEFVANKLMDCEYIHVESEHSAMAAAMGASMVGARAFTATSSQGLAYMHEMLHYVSGSRFPIVMMNANRTLAAPWNIFGDQRDSMAQRDTGWIQVYVENGQEALDMIIQAYRLAEHEGIYLPVMVNLDGFVNTHTYELVSVPSQKEVDEFLPAFVSKNAVDFNNPRSYCMSASTEWNMEFRQQQHEAMMKSKKVIESIDREFGDKFGRYHGGMVKEYKCDDAEVVMVTTGSVSGTSRLVVDSMREKGLKVGLVKLRFFRPFPAEYFRELKSRVKAVGVIDRNLSFGYEGAVGSEVKSAMYDSCGSPKFIDFIAGIAGRDIKKDDIELMYNKLLNLSMGQEEAELQFIGMRWQE